LPGPFVCFAARLIADQIDGLVDAVAALRRSHGAAAPLDRDEVHGCRELLYDLADDLRHGKLVQPLGVALLRQLLRDGGSQLYAPGDACALQVGLSPARAAPLLD
jgi:hypothetical protein